MFFSESEKIQLGIICDAILSHDPIARKLNSPETWQFLEAKGMIKPLAELK